MEPALTLTLSEFFEPGDADEIDAGAEYHLPNMRKPALGGNGGTGETANLLIRFAPEDFDRGVDGVE